MFKTLLCIILFVGVTYRLDWYVASTGKLKVKGKCSYTSQEKAVYDAEIASTWYPEYRVIAVRCK